MVQVFWTVFLGGVFLYGFLIIFCCLSIKNRNLKTVKPLVIQPQPKREPKIKNTNIKNKKIAPKPKPKPKPVIITTSEENKDMVISGLVRIGMKKTNARALVAKMCKNKYYDDAQKLFENCFPHIK